MTGISLGGTAITGVSLGSTPITGVYIGATKLWPAAAPSTKAVIQSASMNAPAGSITGTFSAPPTAGNMLLAEIHCISTAMPSLPVSGWTTLVDTATAPGSTTYTRLVILGRISDGTEQTVSFPAGSSNTTGVLVEISGVTTVNGYAMTVGAAARSGTNFLCPAVTPTVGNTLALAFGGSTSSANGITYTAAAGWAALAWNNTGASYTSGGAYQLQDASLSPVSTTLTTNVALSSNSCSATLLLQ